MTAADRAMYLLREASQPLMEVAKDATLSPEQKQKIMDGVQMLRDAYNELLTDV